MIDIEDITDNNNDDEYEDIPLVDDVKTAESNIAPSPPIPQNIANPFTKLTYSRLALITGIESSLAFSYAITAYSFIDENIPFYVNPIVFASITTFGNFLLRLLENSWALRQHYNPTQLEKIEDKIGAVCFPVLRAFIFAFNDFPTRKILIHEGGHALACYLFFENGKQTIEIFPYGYGSDDQLTLGETSCYGSSGLTHLGSNLGLRERNAIRGAAGYMVNTLWDYITLIIAQLLPEKYFELKIYLRLMVFISVVSECSAAIAAEEGSRNDFFLIRNDLPPLAALVAILGSFLLLQAGMSSYSLWRKSRRQNPVIEVDESVVELSQASLPPLPSVDNRFALFNLGQVSDERKEPLVTPRPR